MHFINVPISEQNVTNADSFIEVYSVCVRVCVCVGGGCSFSTKCININEDSNHLCSVWDVQCSFCAVLACSMFFCTVCGIFNRLSMLNVYSIEYGLQSRIRIFTNFMMHLEKYVKSPVLY